MPGSWNPKSFLAEITALRAAGKSLEAIRDGAMREQGFSICKKIAWNVLYRQGQAEGAAA